LTRPLQRPKIYQLPKRQYPVQLHFLDEENACVENIFVTKWFSSRGRSQQNERRPAVKSDRLMIWQFTAAPENLRLLHRDLDAPEWLVWIPRALSGADLDEAILRGSKPGHVARYETPDGDIVYIGTSQLNRIAQGLGTMARPSAMAATQARRK
jgi:hypothetical protein